MHAPVHVLLIREHAEQVTGGGCCGGLSDDDPLVADRQLFRETRQQQRELGVLHRAIREFFPPRHGKPQVVVDVIDPRNQFYLFFRLWREVIRHWPGLRAALRTALQLFSLPAVIVNGRVISRRGEPLDPDTFCHAVRTTLQAERTTD